ncbi:MAG: carbamoyltransferase HypF [Desulfococcaceae bacterium]|jgi:hydrogenase maturation protein HypF|nr:carbamoyltransferase HypF [Desulfococcaceae bacterium]
MHSDPIANKIQINGIVQGVGFRPFVFQLAKKHGIRGTVANTSAGVLIHAEAGSQPLADFCREIGEKKPRLAHITEIRISPTVTENFKDFSIIQSKGEHGISTLISPDMAVCEDCLREMYEPEDRRFGYPFINCTNCGPRYTIIDDIPYDRPHTSMKVFPMCPDCQAEYDNPEDRRFHAQPNACPVCGPHVFLYDKERNLLAEGKSGDKSGNDAVRKTADLLKAGHILAIKGLGGFHLAADAENPEAVRHLRERKRRAEKPFALMSADLPSIRTYAEITGDDEKLLTSQQRPIVLLEKKADNSIAESVSPGNRYFGVMLPYTPLHYLIFSSGNFRALVMTSANMSEEPIVIDNKEAFERLGDIADYFLIHNRDIYLRSDDSIVRHHMGERRFLRRSRGYAPMPVFLKEEMPPVLACGAELKNTVCLTKGKNAFLSQHIGDLENLETLDFFHLTVRHLQRILNIKPEIIAHDLHPDYMSTRFALESEGMEKIGVQHHHAHIVSCMTENQMKGPVIGLAFDGSGYGTDGSIWGGEILIADYHEFRRAAHLAPVPMPGSTAAIREPWRMALGYLLDTFGDEYPELPFMKQIAEEKISVIPAMIRRQINCPMTSSLGRFFDGMAALCGIRSTVTFEGQAAMELEMMAGESAGFYDGEWQSGETYRIPTAPIVRGIVRDVRNRVPVSEISRKFHNTLIRLFSELCEQIRKDTGLKQVALSGGVFQNVLLSEGMIRSLEQRNFRVFTHHTVPCNDGGISLGQAVAGAAMFCR